MRPLNGYMNLYEVAHFTHLQLRDIADMVDHDEFPMPVRHPSSRRWVWGREVVEDWLVEKFAVQLDMWGRLDFL